MNPYLLPVLEFGPRILQRMFERLSVEQWDRALEPDRFTPREVIAHLADWEPLLFGRMQTAFHTPGAAVEVYDEGQMAIDHDYRNLDPREQLKRFAEQRAKTADWLRNLNAEALSRAVTHPERGMMTIEDQANMLNGHDLYHIEQISAYLNGE